MWISFVYNLSDCLTACVSFHVRLNLSNVVTFPDLSSYSQKLQPKLQKYDPSCNKLKLSFQWESETQEVLKWLRSELAVNLDMDVLAVPHVL